MPKFEDQFEDQQHEERYKNKWYGKYRAFVRDNNDPERLGRCRMEVPAVLGVGDENSSDWAWPCFPYGGSDDTGMFLVPEEGASVWAEFEGGDPQYPIWSGVWLAKSNPGEQPEEAARLCKETTCLDCEEKCEHASDASDNKEHGKFHAHPDYYCPRRKVLIKTETGHTIVMDDRDEEEFLKIIDRAGQILHMDGPVKRVVQSGNSRRRATYDAGMNPESDQPIDIARDIKGAKAFIELTDACHQSIRLEAWHDKEKIHILSCDKTRGRWQKILIDTTKGREGISIWGLGGTQQIRMMSAAGKQQIQMKDRAGSQIIMDGVTGHIVVKSLRKVLINP